jgi:hypothetical protein
MAENTITVPYYIKIAFILLALFLLCFGIYYGHGICFFVLYSFAAVRSIYDAMQGS